jgi:hypothetical protein
VAAGRTRFGFFLASLARKIRERLSGCSADSQQEESTDCHEFRVLHVFILWQAAIRIAACNC